MLASLALGLSALTVDCVEVRAEDKCMCMCICVCVCVNRRGRIHMNERTKFHINQKQIMANHRIKDLSALKMASCPTNFEKSLFSSSRTQLPTRDSMTVAQRVQRLLSKCFLSFSPSPFFSSAFSLSPPANNEQTEIKLNI